MFNQHKEQEDKTFDLVNRVYDYSQFLGNKVDHHTNEIKKLRGQLNAIIERLGLVLEEVPPQAAKWVAKDREDG